MRFSKTGDTLLNFLFSETKIMKLTGRIIFIFACLSGTASILLSAYVAHIVNLEEISQRALQSTLSHQQLHTLALLFLGWLIQKSKYNLWLLLSTIFFICGIFFFSFNIVVQQLFGILYLKAFTPLGGVSFILGWLLLALFGMYDND